MASTTWSCHRCTLDNPISNVICEVCEAPRQTQVTSGGFLEELERSSALLSANPPDLFDSSDISAEDELLRVQLPLSERLRLTQSGGVSGSSSNPSPDLNRIDISDTSTDYKSPSGPNSTTQSAQCVQEIENLHVSVQNYGQTLQSASQALGAPRARISVKSEKTTATKRVYQDTKPKSSRDRVKPPPQIVSLLMSDTFDPEVIMTTAKQISEEKVPPCPLHCLPARLLPKVSGLAIWIHCSYNWEHVSSTSNLKDASASTAVSGLPAWPFGFAFTPIGKRLSAARTLNAVQRYLEEKDAGANEEIYALRQAITSAHSYGMHHGQISMFSPGAVVRIRAADVFCLLQPDPSIPFDPCGADSIDTLLDSDGETFNPSFSVEGKIADHLPSPAVRYFAVKHALLSPRQRLVRYLSHVMALLKLPSAPRQVTLKPKQHRISSNSTAKSRLKDAQRIGGVDIERVHVGSEDDEDDEDHDEDDEDDDDDDDDGDDDDMECLDDDCDAVYDAKWALPKVHFIFQGIEQKLQKRAKLEVKADFIGQSATHATHPKGQSMRVDERIERILLAIPVRSPTEIHRVLLSMWTTSRNAYTYQFVETNEQLAQTISTLSKVQSQVFNRDETNPFNFAITQSSSTLKGLLKDQPSSVQAPLAQSWIKFFLQFPGLTDRKAMAITAVYPSIKSIQEDLKKEHRKGKSVAEYTIANIVVEKRKLGPQIARAISAHLTSLNGNDSVR